MSSSPLVNPRRVAVAQDTALAPQALLSQALSGSGFWEVLKATALRGDVPSRIAIAILPDLAGFRVGSPTATDPSVVEAFIDLLHDEGYSNVRLVSTEDSSSGFCENRSPFALADLLGYRFRTSKGREYDFITAEGEFEERQGPNNAYDHLDGHEIVSGWRDADFRIVFGKNKTDEADGFRLCLDTLLSALAPPDKDYFYRHRLDAAGVILEILAKAPPHFALIDAIVSAHGNGGSRVPLQLMTGTIIASPDIVLTDYVAALKMGTDPSTSRTLSAALTRSGLPVSFELEGTIRPYQEWLNVHPLVIDSTRRRDRWTETSRNVRPWIQDLDPEIFPFRELIDTKCNEFLKPFVRDVNSDVASFITLLALNYGLDSVCSAAHSAAINYNKDALRRKHAKLNISPTEYQEDAYQLMVAELQEIERILKQSSGPDELRWRYLGNAVIFEGSTTCFVEFEEFAEKVDIAKSIQYMNDYIGGVAAPVLTDELGRTIRQVERNIYLPQPNYLAVYDAEEIDVTKIELIEFDNDRQRMYWKTVKSQNSSALFDDGIVTFARDGANTRITISGRQLFSLPKLVELFHLELSPVLKGNLVSAAYKNFLGRTFANFEAVAEGRDGRIGREWREPSEDVSAESRLSEWLERFLRDHEQELAALLGRVPPPTDVAHPALVDPEGFRHFVASSSAYIGSRSPASNRIADWIASVWTDLASAMVRDVGDAYRRAGG